MSAGEAEAIARLVWERGGPGRLPPKPDDPVVALTWAELIDCVAESLAWNGADPEKIPDWDLEPILFHVLSTIVAPSIKAYVASCAADFASQLKQEARYGQR